MTTENDGSSPELDPIETPGSDTADRVVPPQRAAARPAGDPGTEPVETTQTGSPTEDQILSDLEFDSIDPELRGDPLAAASAAEAQAADASGSSAPELAAAKAEAAELLDQLQRERASFTNYRNRTQRDLDTAKQRGMETVLEAMLPVLDQIDRAQAAGELTGAMQSIAEQLDGTLAKFGIERYGEVGETFDPNLHNAMMHNSTPEGEEAPAEPKVNILIDHGYRIGEKVVRPANVGVVGD